MADGAPEGYQNLLDDVVGQTVRAQRHVAAQTAAAVVELYWRIGRVILDQQAPVLRQRVNLCR